MKKLLTILLALFISAGAFAAAKTWTGSASGGVWTTGTNWTGNSAPANGDEVVFNLTTSVTMTITSVQTITLTRLKVYRTTTTNARTLNLEGAGADGSTTISVNQGVYATEGDVFIGERCTLNLNRAGKRINLILKPLAGLVCEFSTYEGVFSPAIYSPCDLGRGFVLEANATGHAEMVQQNNATTPIQGWQQFHFQNTNDYHYVSFPVPSTISGGTDDVCRKANCLCLLSYSNVRLYDEGVGQDWQAWLGNFTDCYDAQLDFQNGRGYEVYTRNTNEEVFGNFLAYNSALPLFLPTSSEDDGWALVGNPFPSGLIFTGATGTGLLGWGWNSALLDTWVSYWNTTYDEYYYYDFYNAGGVPVAFPPVASGRNPTPNIIPRGQGFFVHSITGGADITVNNQARQLATSKAIGKSEEVGKNILYMTLTDAVGKNDYCAVQFSKDATTYRYRDIIKIRTNNTEKSELFTAKSDNAALVMIRLPEVNENTAVPVSLKVGKPGLQTISFDQLNTFNSNVGIILKDNKTNEIIDLKSVQSYTFTAEAGDAEGRFMLFFTNVLGVNDKLTDNSIKVYSSEKSIYVQNTGTALTGTITVFDMVGKELMNVNLSKDIMTKLSTGFVTGYYIVSVQTEKGMFTQKVFLN